MANIVRYKSHSANLVLLGAVFIVAGLLQLNFWYENLFVQHRAYVWDIVTLALNFPTLRGGLIGVFGVIYHVMVASVLIWMLYIGSEVIWFSVSIKTRIIQTTEYRWEMVKGLLFLAVVFIISIWIAPDMHPPSIEFEMIGIELLGNLMLCYSLLAVVKYRGKS